MTLRPATVCRRLGISDATFVEIEAKRRVLAEEADDLREYLMADRDVRHDKRVTFFDQFLDTPSLDLLRLGASLRLRYKGGGTNVYLQYKGPGFRRSGVLFRSEFSSERLYSIVREGSGSDLVGFADTSLREILDHHAAPPMRQAMERHLGRRILSKISRGPILCSYQKDKFIVDLGPASLEPSLDRLFAFHINPRGLHALTTFYEYENEIKGRRRGLEAKLDHIDDLLRFDRRLSKRFELRAERFDKYQRCASCFVPRSRGRRPPG